MAMHETHETIAGWHGAGLHVTIIGDGPAVLLLHGLFSSAATNWIRYGTAKRLAEAGFRLILPDFRGHGKSAAPASEADWPEDVLARDIEAIAHKLSLGRDFVLGGYSLGARTAVRLVARGMRPQALMLAGMGLEGLVDAERRSGWFIRMIRGRGQWQVGSGEYLAQRFMEATVPNPEALIFLLERQKSTEESALRAIDFPTIVIAGAEDRDNGSARDLAAIIPGAGYREIPGNHMASVTRKELGDAMLAFLQGRAAS